MASVCQQIEIEARPEHVWDALRDFGAVHVRLVPGFVTDTRLEDPRTRIVTFVDGSVARERLVTVDDDARRLVYTIVASPLGLTHDNSVAQVVVDGAGRTVFVWTKDILPDEAAPTIAELMRQGLATVKATLERSAVPVGADPRAGRLS